MSAHFNFNSCHLFVPKNFKHLQRFDLLICYGDNSAELEGAKLSTFKTTKISQFLNQKISWAQMQEILRKNNINSGTSHGSKIIKYKISLIDFGKILYSQDLDAVMEAFILERLAPSIPMVLVQEETFFTKIKKKFNWLKAS